MDMSVPVGAASESLRDTDKGHTAVQVLRGSNSSDLDAWLEKVEALGELKRISAEIDPDLEAATLTYLVGNEKSPALLFENIKGHPGHKALYNMIGCNLSRFCLMIGEKPLDHPLKAVQALQQKLGARWRLRRSARDCNLQPEHRHRQRDRHPHLPGAAHVAARRRKISWYGRCSGDTVPGDRSRQCGHLPDDDQGTARGRRLHFARQGRHDRPREVVEDGQADADCCLLRHRSAAVPRRRHQPAEDGMRIRLLFGHQRDPDRTVHRGRHRAAIAGARGDHPGRVSLSGRNVRRRAVR